MHETLRQKREKPRLSLKYSYVCLGCEQIEEVPLDLKCGQCGLPMIPLSGLVKKELAPIKERIAKIGQKKQTPHEPASSEAPSIQTHFAAYATEFRAA